MKKTIAHFLILSMLLLAFMPIALAANLGERNLCYGTYGSDVSQLQQKLNQLGFWAGQVDGIFGKRTQNAVLSFQRAKGLKVDGIVGPATFSALNIRTASRASTGRLSQRDIELLAKLVYAEARGEPYMGQVAVAATVLNRLKDPRYPNTISGIIFQVVNGYYQYSPVADGQINLTPNATARRAVNDALSGVDPTGGATIFYNPSKTNDRWVWSRQTITRIGNHIFAR
ncbi:MAG: spore cortex-lytic enzyme [Tepidanaerobacteraceae bacterium]|jgi:N-acetylmuramoyl-L-alanine amidase